MYWTDARAADLADVSAAAEDELGECLPVERPTPHRLEMIVHRAEALERVIELRLIEQLGAWRRIAWIGEEHAREIP